MRSTRTLAVLGTAGVVGAPTAIAAGDAPPAATAPTAAPVVPLHAPLAGHPTVRASMRADLHGRLLATNRRLAQRAGERPNPLARVWSNERIQRDNRRLRAALRRTRASSSTAGGALAAIRLCESGGDYSTDTGNGFYGAYQFTQASWESVGGTGNPAEAGPAEQDRRAAMLLASSGTGNWPVCGA